MSRLRIYSEHHAVARTGWLRAAVLGANDGIVSTGNLIVGVAASGTRPGGIVIAGVAALVSAAVKGADRSVGGLSPSVPYPGPLVAALRRGPPYKNYIGMDRTHNPWTDPPLGCER